MPVKWMAPEALLEAKYTSASDVWAFGVLAYEVTSFAMTPYGALGPQEVMEALKTGFRLPAPAACPPDLFVVRFWAVQRADHFSFLFFVLQVRNDVRVLGLGCGAAACFPCASRPAAGSCFPARRVRQR